MGPQSQRAARIMTCATNSHIPKFARVELTPFLRRVGTAVATTSLSAAIAIAVLWAQSYLGGIGVLTRAHFDAAGHRWGFTTRDGLACVQWRELRTDKWRSILYEDIAESKLTFGFGFRAAPATAVVGSQPVSFARQGVVYVPMWFLFLLMIVAPILWAPGALRRRHIERLRSALSRCVCCGYDLRATPERCPECGTAPPTAALQPHIMPLERTVPPT
jgi:hypothetical protein